MSFHKSRVRSLRVDEVRELFEACRVYGSDNYLEHYYSLTLDYDLDHQEAISLAGVPVSGSDCRLLKAAGLPVSNVVDLYDTLCSLDYNIEEYSIRVRLYLDLVSGMGMQTDEAREYVLNLCEVNHFSWAEARRRIDEKRKDNKAT